MEEITIPAFSLIGLKLNDRTTNENNQSSVDCGNLWQEFEKGNFAERIPNKLDNKIYGVYFDYLGDHTAPFSYFIGCKVLPNTPVPLGMDSLEVAKHTYTKVIALGQMPDCVSRAWREIWDSEIDRSFQTDFEVYDHRSKDWNNAEVDIFVSIRP